MLEKTVTLGKHRRIAKTIQNYGKREGPWPGFSGTVSKMTPAEANAFLLGVILDRSVPYQTAWDAGRVINYVLGDDQDVAALWQRLAQMSKKRLGGFLRYGNGGKAFHRHWGQFTRQLPVAAQHILEVYEGDPRRIWRRQRNVELVRSRLDAIHGIGPALSRMAVRLLAAQYGLLGGRAALKQLDIKPDIHVMRVFLRSGLIARRGGPADAVEAARQLAPRSPASLDAAWEIGRTWCRRERPNCRECVIGKDCARLLRRARDPRP
jgi:endonuclease III